MSVLTFAKDVMGVHLSYYQQDLLNFICSRPNGYLSEVLPKKPSGELLTVVKVYEKYIDLKSKFEFI